MPEAACWQTWELVPRGRWGWPWLQLGVRAEVSKVGGAFRGHSPEASLL